MTRKIMVLLFIAVLVIAAGCAPAEEVVEPDVPAPDDPVEPDVPEPDEPDVPEPDEEYVIGFSQVSLDSPFYVVLMEVAEERAAELGAELIYVDAQNDVAKQNRDVQDLIERGIDVLILNAVSPTGVAPALDAAEAAGVPVVAIDRPTEGNIATWVGRDNKLMGRMCGELALELLGGAGSASGKVIEMQGAAGCDVMMARRDGFREVLELEEGVTMVESPYCEYVRSQAVAAFQDLIQVHPDTDLVYSHNDDMGMGVLQVLESLGMQDDVFMVSVDGLMEAVKAIQDGKYHGTTMNDPGYLGALTVEVAVGVLQGEQYPDFVDAGSKLITQDNAADFYNPDLPFASMQ